MIYLGEVVPLVADDIDFVFVVVLINAVGMLSLLVSYVVVETVALRIESVA